MILVCGGRKTLEEPDFYEYPPVIAFVPENEPDRLEKVMAMVVDPFCVRVLDKDLYRFMHSEECCDLIQKFRGLD